MIMNKEDLKREIGDLIWKMATNLVHGGKMSPWDLGGDGKHFCGFHPEEEWYVKLMRK